MGIDLDAQARPIWKMSLPPSRAPPGVNRKTNPGPGFPLLWCDDVGR